MNTTTTWVVGAVAVVIVLGAIFFAMRANPTITDTNATTTDSTAAGDTTGDTTATDTQPARPAVVTDSQVAPTDTTAVVSGEVTPMGPLTAYWYEYGATSALGQKTASQTMGYGYKAIPAPGYITGLTKGTKYYFRLVAQNDLGTTNGTQYSFTTTVGTPAPVGSIPSVRTTAATGITASSANVSGVVTPNKVATQYWFEYGTTSSLGFGTDLTAVGSGVTGITASGSLTNLLPKTKYFYRINAQNQFGTVVGAMMNFTTK